MRAFLVTWLALMIFVTTVNFAYALNGDTLGWAGFIAGLIAIGCTTYALFLQK